MKRRKAIAKFLIVINLSFVICYSLFVGLLNSILLPLFLKAKTRIILLKLTIIKMAAKLIAKKGNIIAKIDKINAPQDSIVATTELLSPIVRAVEDKRANPVKP